METTFPSAVLYREETASETSPAVAIDGIAFASLCALIFTIPWEDSVPLLGGFVLGRWVGLLTFAAVVLRMVMTGQYRKVSALHVWMMGLVGWAAASFFWSVDRDATAIRAGTYLQLLTVAWLIWELAVTEARVEKLLQSYVFGTCVLSISTLVNFSAGYTASDAAAAEGVTRWHDSRFTVLGVNENDLGLMLALSIPMIFYLLVRRKGPYLTPLLWAQLALCFTALILSGSRGGLLSGLVALVMLPLSASLLPRWQRIAAVAVCIAGLAAGAYLVPASTRLRIMGFTSEISEGTMTHRTVIWAAGMEAFRDHALAGVGAGSYGSVVLKALDIPYAAHNTFLSVLVELGVVGALLFLGFLASIWYSVWQMRYLDKCLWIILLLTWGTGVSALTWEYHKPTWFLFGLVAAHLYSRRDNGLRESL
jgi:O-antigen ligase